MQVFSFVSMFSKLQKTEKSKVYISSSCCWRCPLDVSSQLHIGMPGFISLCGWTSQAPCNNNLFSKLVYRMGSAEGQRQFHIIELVLVFQFGHNECSRQFSGKHCIWFLDRNKIFCNVSVFNYHICIKDRTICQGVSKTSKVWDSSLYSASKLHC